MTEKEIMETKQETAIKIIEIIEKDANHPRHVYSPIIEKIKATFNYEADIEFAIKNDHIFVLQTRPITTLKTDNPIILDNSNIVESYPGVSLPLTQDFVKEIYHDIFYFLEWNILIFIVIYMYFFIFFI